MANLVFKYSWDHRPFPYNSAQGKRQFMLPFASGIPNLTPDWTQVMGLGTAATKNVGTANGEVAAIGPYGVADFGYGASPASEPETDLDVVYKSGTQKTRFKNAPSNIYTNPFVAGYGPSIVITRGGLTGTELFLPYYTSTRANNMAVIAWSYNSSTGNLSKTEQIVYTSKNNVVYTTDNSATSGKLVTVANTGELSSKGFTVDSNGVYKAASPIVRLFADSLELNEDASKQPISFEKLDVGDYLIKDSLGFAKEGWYIEMPKDANGNVVVAVSYEQLEDGNISVKTYKKKFDIETASIVPDFDNPVDIPKSRWIDIRLHEEPEPEPEEPLSETPVDFQPTNLSEAVAAALAGVEPPEISDTDETL
ncbi:phage tail protein [Acinetobacter baumannii]|uniref:phage tail fiber protein n=1 Tax=Acinetobacter baumannii TaxID=470 RepID=UPI003D6A6E48